MTVYILWVTNPLDYYENKEIRDIYATRELAETEEARVRRSWNPWIEEVKVVQ